MPVKRVNVPDSVDRIGSLPDGVLRHILSFLPTKTAVSTCILSTRWRYLFPFSNNLDFNESLIFYPQRNDESQDDRTGFFFNFVDWCIMLMDATLVDKFRLKCTSYINPSRVNSWICAALLRNVRELDLWYTPRREVWKKPFLVFTCSTLVVLKLGVYVTLNVPASVDLPCLKSLHLDRIRFADDISTQRLFSSCPVIEDLVIEGCVMEDVHVLNLSSFSLKRLTLDKQISELFDFKLVLDAPNLIYLKYTICVGEDYTLKNLHSLSEAHILFDQHSDEDEGDMPLSEFLEGIVGVQTLFLSDAYEYLRPSDLDGLPLLENLTRSVFIRPPSMKLSLVMTLLRCTPNLEEFFFDGGIRDAHEDESVDVPSCVSSCLKAFDFTLCHYDGSGIENDLESLKYFLKIANVLEKMWIRVGSFNREAVEKLMETVKKFGHSKTCEIKFFWKLPTSTGWVELQNTNCS